MPAFAYSNSAFVTLTKISSSVMNQYFADIKTFFNTTKLDNSNIQLLGLIGGNLANNTVTTTQIGSGVASVYQSLLADGAGAVNWITSGGSREISNLTLAASVGSNLLTVSAKDIGGSTASSTSPIRIAFRSSTSATGTYLLRAVTASLSINTVAIGCTLGLVSAQNQYVYVYAIDNAGTVELALAGSRAFDEGSTVNTTIINGSSTDASTLYSTTARTGVAIRLLGRIKSNQATSGTYVTTPTEVALVPLNTNAVPRSEVWVTNGNANGSGSTKSRRWTTIVKNVGTAITYADSSTLAGTFTINEDGIYAISMVDGATAATATFGATRNCSALTTDLSSLTAAQGGLGRVVSVANQPGMWSCTLNCSVGDVIRGGNNADCTNSSFDSSGFRIVKISN